MRLPREGGGGHRGLPAGSSTLGKPQALPRVPQGVFPVFPPPSRGASFPRPRCYPSVGHGQVWPLAGPAASGRGEWHGIAVLILGKTMDGPSRGAGVQRCEGEPWFSYRDGCLCARMVPGAEPGRCLSLRALHPSRLLGMLHRFCCGREGVPSPTLGMNGCKLGMRGAGLW